MSVQRLDGNIGYRVLGEGLQPDLSADRNISFGKPTVITGAAISGHHKAIDHYLGLYTRHCEHGQKKPHRRDICPSDIKAYLPNTVLMDVESLAPVSLRIRLMGTKVAETYGEATGKSVDALRYPEAVDRIKAMTKQCFDIDEPVLSITVGIARTQMHLAAVSLYMPFYSEDGAPALCMVAVFLEKLSTLQGTLPSLALQA